MRPTDARLVLTRLFGAYRTTADEATVLMYAEALAPVDLDIAMTAVTALVQTEDYLPSVARVMAAVRIEQRRVDHRTRALPPAKPRNWRDVNLAGVRKARAMLAPRLDLGSE